MEDGRNFLCPNSSDGQHNFHSYNKWDKLEYIDQEGGRVAVRRRLLKHTYCLYCGQVLPSVVLETQEQRYQTI